MIDTYKVKRELEEPFEQMGYMKRWFELADEMDKSGFTWSSLLEDEEWNQYMSSSLLTMSSDEWDEVMKATEAVQQILTTMYRHFKEISHIDLLKLKLPYPTWEATFTDMGNSMFSYFSRFDLIQSGDEIRVIEVNVDTPTGLVEPSVANRIICNAHGVSQPNSIEEKLSKAWEMIIRDYDIKESDTIYYSSYADHEEDFQTVRYNLSHCSHLNKEYIGIEDIVVGEDGLYTNTGSKISFLYRLYPLEYLPDDRDEDGRYIGRKFLDHIAEGRVKIINPPSAFLMQAKTVLAVIWEMHESNSPVFTEEEHRLISTYFLPTYFSPDRFTENNEPFVSKPIWGREGGGVTIVEEELITKDTTPYYYEQPKIYQKYIEMPNQTVGTWDGDYHGKLLIGSHVIGGEPAGLFLRIGEKITGNLSMFMGLTVKNHENER